MSKQNISIFENILIYMVFICDLQIQISNLFWTHMQLQHIPHNMYFLNSRLWKNLKIIF
jgi:hypothetical protein